MHMAWYQDLQPCNYFRGQYASFLRAVGWLDNSESFPRGVCEAGVVQRLVELREKLWEPTLLHFRGWHTCNLCTGGDSDATSCYNMFVPADGVIYVCPEGILHYVLRHKYLPPREFAKAVVECPPPQSKEYFQAIAASGGCELLELDSWYVRGVAPELLKPAPPPILTQEAVRRIQEGMTVKEVEAILGPGNLVRKEESARFTGNGVERSATALLDWWEEGRLVTILFENDKVLKKQQQGLD
jgi:hypothetical protein